MVLTTVCFRIIQLAVSAMIQALMLPLQRACLLVSAHRTLGAEDDWDYMFHRGHYSSSSIPRCLHNTAVVVSSCAVHCCLLYELPLRKTVVVQYVFNINSVVAVSHGLCELEDMHKMCVHKTT